MPTPTKIALGKHAKAVVLLAVDATDTSQQTYDFEWFNTDAAVKEFVDVIRVWADEDVHDDGDLFHLIAEVADAKADPIVLGAVTYHGTDASFGLDWKSKVFADPNLLVAAGPKPRKVAPPKVKPQLKARKANAAAAIVGQGTEVAAEAPAPKPRAVRKPRMGAKAEAPQDAAPAPVGAAALKAKLAAKKVAPVKGPDHPAVKAIEADDAEKEANLLAAVVNVLNGADPKAEADKVMAMAGFRAMKPVFEKANRIIARKN